jgi:hypothetical protein
MIYVICRRRAEYTTGSLPQLPYQDFIRRSNLNSAKQGQSKLSNSIQIQGGCRPRRLYGQYQQVEKKKTTRKENFQSRRILMTQPRFERGPFTEINVMLACLVSVRRTPPGLGAAYFVHA